MSQDLEEPKTIAASSTTADIEPSNPYTVSFESRDDMLSLPPEMEAFNVPRELARASEYCQGSFSVD